jgi:multidrug efflux pump subunit AcrB
VAIAVVISGVVALTLTPALCALLLKQSHKESPLFRPFNRFFDGPHRVLHQNRGPHPAPRHHRPLALFGLVIGAGAWLLRLVPGSFVPSEDQGYLISALMLPDGATLKRTAATGELMRQAMTRDPAVAHTFVVSGFDLIGGGNKPNAGTIFIPLKPWSERQSSADELAAKFMGAGMMLPDGLGLVFNPPPIMGLGTAGGFEVYVQNKGDGDPMKLNEVVRDFMALAKRHKEFSRINTFFRPTFPSSTWKWTKPRPFPWASPWPASTRPCKAPWARSM